MNLSEKPLIHPGRVTLTATYDGEGTSYWFSSKGFQRERVVMLRNVRRGDDVASTEEIFPFPKELESIELRAGALLQFIANVAVRRVEDGWYYKLSRPARYRVLPAAKGG